jgi:hypothetical protein
MPIFRFDPTPETVNDPRWEASKIREPFWIRAQTQNAARERAALILVNFVTRRTGRPMVYSPWLDPKFADCDVDQPSVDVPDGIIVTLSGHTHS